jgi:hypothetical protein
MRDLQPDDVDADVVPIKGPWVHTVEIDGEAVLLDEHRNRLHLLNATGALVWACSDGRATLNEIVTDISDVLGVDHQEALADTVALARHLGEQGLLANVAPGPDVEDLGIAPRPESADDEAEDCDDEVLDDEVEEPSDPWFIAEPPNP